MRSVLRILSVGLIWAGLEAFLLVVTVLLLGAGQTSTPMSNSLAGPSTVFFPSYSFGPLPSIPVGWFVFLVAFGAGFALADFGETVKAAAFATFTGDLAALLFVSLLGIPFPDAISQADAQAAFFGFLSIPLFLMGMVGGILGCVIGGWAVPTLRGRPC